MWYSLWRKTRMNMTTNEIIQLILGSGGIIGGVAFLVSRIFRTGKIVQNINAIGQDLSELKVEMKSGFLRIEQDMRSGSLKLEQDMRSGSLKLEQDMKSLSSKVEQDIKSLSLKIEQDMRSESSKVEQNMKSLSLKVEQDMKSGFYKAEQDLKETRKDIKSEIAAVGGEILILREDIKRTHFDVSDIKERVAFMESFIFFSEFMAESNNSRSESAKKMWERRKMKAVESKK